MKSVSILIFDFAILFEMDTLMIIINQENGNFGQDKLDLQDTSDPVNHVTKFDCD